MDSGFLQLQQLLQTLIGVGTQLAVLAVALLTVRPRNARAGGLLAGAACMFLAGTLLWRIAVQTLPRLLGATDSSRTYLWLGLAHTVWAAGAWALVLLAVVELARPAASPGSDPAP